jgi:hypothetical protein
MSPKTAVLIYRSLASLALAWGLAGLFPAQALAQGCAMCKTALSGSDDPLAVGIFWSVMLMMGMPFVLFASIGGWIFYTYRNASRSPHPPADVLPFDTTQTKKKEDLP